MTIAPTRPDEIDDFDDVLSDLDVLRARVLELEAAASRPVLYGPDGVTPLVAKPAHVAPGELIESAWGNLVVDNLNDFETRIASNTARITAVEPLSNFWKMFVSTEVQVFGGGTIAPVGTFTVAQAGWYLIHLVVYGFFKAGGAGSMNLGARCQAQNGVYSALQGGANTGASISCLDVFNLTAGTAAVEVVSQATSGSFNFIAGRQAVVTRVKSGI